MRRDHPWNRAVPPAALLSIFLSSHHARRVLDALALLAAIHVAGAIGYMYVGAPEVSALDGVYMTFITVATIGYAETVDLSQSPGGRVFTMLIAFAGIGTMTYIFSNMTAFMLETDLNRAYRRRRMQAALEKLSNHYIVCGGGRVGAYVIDELEREARPFVVVESDREVIDHLTDRNPDLPVVQGDATRDEVLREAGLARAAGVFAVTGDDSRNLVISLSVKQLNPAARVVARVHDRGNEAKTLRAGADAIVSPEFTGGRRIASIMMRPTLTSLLDVVLHEPGGFGIEEIAVPAGRSPFRVADLGTSREWLLLALRDGADWRMHPSADEPLSPGQVIVAMATQPGRAELQRRLDRA